VAVHVTGDIGQNTKSSRPHRAGRTFTLQVYFDGDFQTKAQNIVNTSGYAVISVSCDQSTLPTAHRIPSVRKRLT